MALPSTIVSEASGNGHNPPHKSAGGDFYAVKYNVTDGINVFKNSDPTTDSWTAQDTDNNPGPFSVFSEPLGDVTLTSITDSDLIHIATGVIRTFNGECSYRYYQFDMSDDTWNVIDEFAGVLGDAPNKVWCSIAVRSDGDIIVAYNGDTDGVKGSAYQRVDYARREPNNGGFDWTTEIALDDAGELHYGNTCVVKGPLTDDMHVIWQSYHLDFPVPPSQWSIGQGKTIDPSNNLSSVDAVSGTDTGGILMGFTHIVSWDDSGTQRVAFCGIDDTAVDTRTYGGGIEDGSDDIDINLVSHPGVVDSSANGDDAPISMVELNGDLHSLFRGGSTGGFDADMYYETSDDDGATWTSPVEEIDAITLNFISATVYDRGGDTVMAYIYDESGSQLYNEKVLVSGGVEPITPFITRSFAVVRAANY